MPSESITQPDAEDEPPTFTGRVELRDGPDYGHVYAAPGWNREPADEALLDAADAEEQLYKEQYGPDYDRLATYQAEGR